MRNFSGYLRQFEPALRELLERDLDVHIARDRDDDMRGNEWAAVLQAEFPRLTWSQTPHPSSDRWYHLRREVRLTADYAGFLAPEYASLPEIVDRSRRRASDRVVAAFEGSRSPLRLRALRALATRTLETVEHALPSSAAARRYIRDLRPDVVLLTPHLMPGSLHPDFLRAAIDLGLPTVLCVASWDNLSSKQHIRSRPDVVTVWNETQRSEAIERHAIEPKRIAVTGAQVYDPWFTWPARPRDEFCARVGLPADRAYVLYAGGALFPAQWTEAQWAERWLTALRAAPQEELRDLAVLVRPHPKRFAEWEKVDFGRFGDVALWPQEGRMPVDAGARADFFDSLYHSSGVVGINTSAMIEAAIAGKRVHTVLVPEFSDSQHGTLHFRFLTEVGGGVVQEAASLDEHFAQLAITVAGGGDDGGVSRGFLEAFVRPQGLDLPSASVFADVVGRAATHGRHRPPRPHPGRLALRFAMEPLRVGFHGAGVGRHRRKRAVGAARRSST